MCQETNGVTSFHRHPYLQRTSSGTDLRVSWSAGMNFTTNQELVPDRDSLPFKKREKLSLPEQQCNTVSFKEPYPYKNHVEFKAKVPGPLRPVPRRVPALYQPWIQTPTRPKHHIHPAFKEQHGWAGWKEPNALSSGLDFSYCFKGHNHLSTTQTLQPGRSDFPSRFSTFSLFGDSCCRERKAWERRINGNQKGPYGRKEEKTVHTLLKTSFSSMSKGLLDGPHQDSRSNHKSRKADLVSGHLQVGASTDGSNTCISSTKDALTASNRFPWLLPHFMAGSLIELRDGRLRKVEHLQTEDFLLGSLSCPDLRLSCCTVQNISPSASSSISRILILLQDQQSQELVDVYVEYPFFVRGQGWSSCSPQRTAHLCGLQCRQLTVGDICLALTPVSSPKTPLKAPTKPKTSNGTSERESKPLTAQTSLHCEAPLKHPAGGQKKIRGTARRRHHSAP